MVHMVTATSSMTVSLGPSLSERRMIKSPWGLNYNSQISNPIEVLSYSFLIFWEYQLYCLTDMQNWVFTAAFA
jgi:hypothetical protein